MRNLGMRDVYDRTSLVRVILLVLHLVTVKHFSMSGSLDWRVPTQQSQGSLLLLAGNTC